MAEWYCMVRGQQHGPLSQGQLQAWIAEGRVGASDLVWCQGMASWLPACQVSQFSGFAAAPQRPQGLSSGTIGGIVIACVLGGLLLVGVIVALVILPGRKRGPDVGGPFGRASEEARRIRCRNNLNQLAKGMATYLNERGDNRYYPWPAGLSGCGTTASPNFGGAEWLASLYWTKIIPDPGVYVCPSSPDDNEQGMELGAWGTPGGRPLSGDAVSYASFGDRSVGIYMRTKQNGPATYASSKLAIRDDFPPNEPMASDDTDEPINHGERDNGGMAVLFFDSHVEYWTHTRVDLELGVGQGDLCALRN